MQYRANDKVLVNLAPNGEPEWVHATYRATLTDETVIAAGDRPHLVYVGEPTADNMRRVPEDRIKPMRPNDIDTFTTSYIETALWSSINPDDEDAPLDRDFDVDDISDETLAEIVADCARFQSENRETLDVLKRLQESEEWAPSGSDDVDEITGHDFWLTRNSHGAGFWDGDYPESQANVLDKASESFGEYNLYVGDDGKIYGM